MITPAQKQLLQDLKTTAFGGALKEYLKDEMEVIGDIKKCESWEDTIGRKHALKLLAKIFSFLDKEEKPAKGKNQYS